MAVIVLKEKMLERKEKELEGLINSQASEYQGGNIYNIMAYADHLENINPKNPFMHLAEGILHAKYTPPNRSYAQSVWHLNLFLKAFPYHEHGVWWRLYSTTELVSDTPYTKFLARISKEAVEAFPTNVPILNAAYRAYVRGVLDTKEALKVATRIHYLCPDDEQIRRDIDFLRRSLKDEEVMKEISPIQYRKNRPKILRFRGVQVDNKKG